MRTVFAYSLAIYSALIFAGIWGMPDGTASESEPTQRETQFMLHCPKRSIIEGSGAVHVADRLESRARKEERPAK